MGFFKFLKYTPVGVLYNTVKKAVYGGPSDNPDDYISDEQRQLWKMLQDRNASLDHNLRQFLPLVPTTDTLSATNVMRGVSQQGSGLLAKLQGQAALQQARQGAFDATNRDYLNNRQFQLGLAGQFGQAMLNAQEGASAQQASSASLLNSFITGASALATGGASFRQGSAAPNTGPSLSGSWPQTGLPAHIQRGPAVDSPISPYGTGRGAGGIKTFAPMYSNEGFYNG